MAPSTQAEYSKLKVTELKELLTARNLPTNGIKSELITRLLSSESSAAAAPAVKDVDVAADDYEVNWEEDDTTKGDAKAATPAQNGKEEVKPAAAAPAAAPATTAPSATETKAAPVAEEPAGEKKKFVFKSLAAQFEEEEARKKAEAEAKKAAATAPAATETKTDDAAAAPATETPAEKPGRIAAEFINKPPTAASESSKVTVASLDDEIAKIKKRAERFGQSVDENETLKRLERARKFAVENESGEGDAKGANQPRLLKNLDQALPERTDRKRRGENNERGGKRQRGRGGRNDGRGERREPREPREPREQQAPKKSTILDDPTEKAKAEARAKRFASAA